MRLSLPVVQAAHRLMGATATATPPLHRYAVFIAPASLDWCLIAASQKIFVSPVFQLSIVVVATTRSMATVVADITATVPQCY